ncbi:MAG: peptidoglycan-associated lipoprotein Pal [Betaproteobacteria bacterium]|nr:peptidoglycan-associated lipoprotein Pal [Betaproteobacteria bacterium]MDE2309804.1 peptidoglycan-associated lipoprotein Pal [Betaproteobacteria bacterium]
MKKLLIGVLLVNLLAACASQKPKEVAGEAKPAPAAEAPKAVEAAPAPAPAPVAPVAVDPLNDPNSILAKRSTYYPFDVYVVQDADKPVVEAHARYLSEHANRNVRLEGNCDERGSTEYNLGLGQRRADGVKKMLQVGGAKDSQIETISYGEEKPRLTCHEEKCWKENRRTDLNYR